MSGTYDDHAALYDVAFDWDTEADWLLERLGPAPCALLEPGCGSGRLFPALARRGVTLVGVDRSETMLERARRRMRAAGLPAPVLVRADMAEFRLDRTVDGAYCPINTLSHLGTFERTARHLDRVAEHLRAGARYLIQVDLADLGTHAIVPPDEHSRWDVDGPEGRLRCSWHPVAWDAARRIETQACRFEYLTGPRQGAVFEDTHAMLLWDWPAWRRLVDSSPFRQTAAFGGRKADFLRPLEVGPDLEGARLAWHELERR